MPAVVQNIPTREYKVIPPSLLTGSQSACSWLEANVQSNTTIYAPRGTILVDREIEKNGVSNVRFEGPGTYTCSGRFSNALWYLSGGCENWTWDGIGFDHNADAATVDVVPYLTYYNLLVYTEGSTNRDIYIRNCKFLDCYTDSLFLYQLRGKVVVENNLFTWSNTQQVAGGTCVRFTSIPATVICNDNIFEFEKPTQAGIFDPQYGMPAIFMSGITTGGQICRNTIRYAGRDDDTSHRVGCIDLYNNCYDLLIADNDLLAAHQPIRISRGVRITCERNNIKMFGPGKDDSVPAIEVYSGRTVGSDYLESDTVTIRNNKIEYVGDQSAYNPGEYGASHFRYYQVVAPAIQLSSESFDFDMKNIVVTGNSIRNMPVGIRTVGSMDRIKIEDNELIDCNTYMTHIAWGSAIGTAANEKYQGISIRRNECKRSAQPTYTTCTVDNTTNIFTAAGHGLVDNDRIYFKWSGTYANRPQGIQSLTDQTVALAYYVLKIDNDTFKVELYIDDGEVDVTTDGTSGTLSFTTTHDVGSGGLIAGNHGTYAGTSGPIVIEDNYVEGTTRITGSAIATRNIDVYLRRNRVKNYNRAYYCRGQSTNFIRQAGNYQDNCLIFEDYEDSVVTNEQPVATASDLQIDTLSPSFVYSCGRRLMSAYSGDAFRLRESSGDTLLDIGYTLAAEKDTAAVLDHCGANSGFVERFYDQSGNNHDMIQATATKQAQLVSSGSLIRVNNRNMPLGVGGATGTSYSGGTFTLSDFTFFAVVSLGNANQGIFNFDGGATRVDFYYQGASETLFLRRSTEQATYTGIQAGKLIQVTGYNADASKQLWVNGVAGTENTTSDPYAISGLTMFMYSVTATVYNMAGYIAELIIIPGTVSASDKAVIEQNQIDFWGVAT